LIQSILDLKKSTSLDFLMQNIFKKGDKDHDQILVRDISRGHPEALGQLYDQYAAIVYGLIYRIVRQPYLAEEVLKSVFLQIYHEIDDFEGRQVSLLTWILQKARNAALIIRSTQKNSDSLENQVVEKTVHERELSLDGGEIAVVEDGISENLSEIEITVWNYFYFQGLGLKEIQVQTGLREIEIKSIIRSAVQNFNRIRA